MNTRFWMSTMMAATLCLAGCGSSDGQKSDGSESTILGGAMTVTPPAGGMAQQQSTDEPMGGNTQTAPALVKTIKASAQSFNIPPLNAGASHESSVSLTNTGNTRVVITEITMTDVQGGQAELLYNPTKLPGITRDGQDTFRYPLPVDTDTPFQLHVYFTKSGAEPVSGTVTINGDFDSSPLILPIKGVEGLGSLSAQPTEIDFGRVRPLNETFRNLTGLSGEKVETVIIENSGQMNLTISKIELIKGGLGAEALDFALKIGDADPIADPTVYADPDADGTPGLSPGARMEIQVRYAPSGEGRDNAKIVIDSDDPSKPETTIQLSGNQAQGCIEVSPDTLVTPGQLGRTVTTDPISIRNCGTEPLIVDFVGFAAGTDGEIFQLNNPFPMFPAELAVGTEPVTMTLDYTPRTGTISPANVLIMSNDPDAQKNLIIVKVSGETPCQTDEDCDATTMQICNAESRCITPEMMMPE